MSENYELLDSSDDLYQLEKNTVLVTRELGDITILPSGILIINNNKNRLASDAMFDFATSVKAALITYMASNYPNLQFNIQNAMQALPSSANSDQGYFYIFTLIDGDSITAQIKSELKKVAMNITASVVNTESLFGAQIKPSDFEVEPEKMLCLEGSIEDIKKKLASKLSDKNLSIGTGINEEQVVVESFKKAEFIKKEPTDISGYGVPMGYSLENNLIFIKPYINGELSNTTLHFHCANTRLHLVASKAYNDGKMLKYIASMHMDKNSKAKYLVSSIEAVGDSLTLSVSDGS